MMNSESKFAMKAKRPSQSFPQNISHCAVAALATEITATVPSGATTGAVSVATCYGTLNSNPPFQMTK